MEFRIKRKENENLHKYPTDNLDIASTFTREVKKELGDFVLSIVVFGSSARRETSERSDIDVLIISDDATYILTEELIEGYRIIIDNLIRRVSTKLHITSMTFTSFWEHAKVGDPVVVNILRDGVALEDKGFFFPLRQQIACPCFAMIPKKKWWQLHMLAGEAWPKGFCQELWSE